MQLDPPRAGDEAATLTAFLDYNRAAVLDKAAGLTEAQLATAVPPSTLTLAGLLHHLALVEHWWFHQCFAGAQPIEPWASAPWDEDPDWEFTVAADLDGATLRRRYQEAIARSHHITEAAPDLSALSVATDDQGEPWSLRWILAHMLEETARHAGHADLIRESIDGHTGWRVRPSDGPESAS